MVGLNGSILKYMLLPVMALIFITIFAINGYAVSCTSYEQECCNGSQMSCCRKLYPANPGDPVPSYDLSACMGPIKPACMEFEVAMSNCSKCLVGSKCYQTSDCSYECRGGGGIIPMCIEDEVAMSNCGNCLIGSKCYQLSDCSYQCRDSIALSCSVGDTQYRIDPNDECGTQTRSCCNTGLVLASWSNWGELCTPTCKSSDKPTCSLSNGTCSYSCRCVDTSWTDCRMIRSCNTGYDTINMSNGNICCQKSDGSGPRCATDGELDYGWVFQTNGYSCNNADLVTSTDPNITCGPCSKGTAEWHCVIRPRGASGNWDCTLYICQFGGSVKATY